MKKVAPRILQGFMELEPREQLIFNNMLDTIRQTYQSFGFLPMDTATMEYSEVLFAKAGEEIGKQIYRFSKGDNDICLRYDQTVSLARFVASHANTLTFPFKRFQIGKVFRGERPQKGRFREFYQCDIDIVGNGELDLIYDAEVPAALYAALQKLDFGGFVINFSNRKLLSGLLESLGIQEKIKDVLRTVDKLDKIGAENVAKLLDDCNLTPQQTKQVLQFVQTSGTWQEVIAKLKSMGIENQTFQTGVLELEFVLENLVRFGVPEENFCINLSIVRGLDYYTGTVYETTISGKREIGSIAGGGRYEHLADAFSDKFLPASGMALGLTRLFDVLKSENLLSAKFDHTTTQTLVIPMNKQRQAYAISVANALRSHGVPTEVFFEDTKFKNKMSYANKSNIPYAIILGEDEEKNGTVALKNLKQFSQTTCTITQAVNQIIKND